MRHLYNISICILSIFLLGKPTLMSSATVNNYSTSTEKIFLLGESEDMQDEDPRYELEDEILGQGLASMIAPLFALQAILLQPDQAVLPANISIGLPPPKPLPTAA